MQIGIRNSIFFAITNNQKLTRVSGDVMTQRHKSEMARLAMNTFRADLISLERRIVVNTRQLPKQPTEILNIIKFLVF